MEVKLSEGERILVEMAGTTRIISRKHTKSGKIQTGLKLTRKSNRIIITNTRLIEFYGGCCKCSPKSCHITMLRDIKEVGYAFIPGKRFCCCHCKGISIFNVKTDLEQNKFGIKVDRDQGRLLLALIMDASTAAKAEEAAACAGLASQPKQAIPLIDKVITSTDTESVPISSTPETTSPSVSGLKPFLKYSMIIGGALGALFLLGIGASYLVRSCNNSDQAIPEVISDDAQESDDLFTDEIPESDGMDIGDPADDEYNEAPEDYDVMGLEGTIAGAPVHMSLTREGSAITGQYYYDRQMEKGVTTQIQLRGSIDNGNIVLEEYNGDNVTGVLSGVLTDGTWNGTYVRARDGKEFSLSLHQMISEFTNQESVSENNWEEEETVPFQLTDKKPSFNGGGQDEFSKWMNSNLVYPEAAKENGVQGRVTVQFTVKADGSVSNVEVVRGAEPSLDKEAVRVISSSPKWEPGEKDGSAVNVTITLPVIFDLP